MMLEQKAKNNPVIAQLLKQRNTIDEQINMVDALMKEK